MWKGIAVLAGTAGVIVLGILGLARITIPDDPSFSEGFTEASLGSDGVLDFVPTAIGGELEVTGAREGTLTLSRGFQGPGYGLGDDTGRIFFEADPLSIAQMYYGDLTFFTDPEDCMFTPGRLNEEIGVAAVALECVDLADIRDKGMVSVKGYAALPADMVVERDLPETGGTVTVGDEIWEIVDPVLIIGPAGPAIARESGEVGMLLQADVHTGSIFFALLDDQSLQARSVHYEDETGQTRTVELSPNACSVATEDVAVINPQAEIVELTFDCAPVEVGGLGSVPIEGTVLFERIYYIEP